VNEPIINEERVVPTQTEQRHEHDKQAFVRHVQDQGKEIPSNFESAEAWFDSLTEAQSRFTQGQQEIADLKKQYNENGVTNPNFQPTEDAPEQPLEETVAEDVENLRIQDPESGNENPSDEIPMEMPSEVTVGEWNDWGAIIDASEGTVPDDLRSVIKSKLNIDDKIIDDYMNQRSMLQQQNVRTAAETVGGQEELNKIMAWASSNLTEDERLAVNGQLAGPGYKTAVMGLKARYEASDNVSVARGREASATPNRTSTANAFESVQRYASQQEMFADQRNPRYRTDSKFRQAVEQRIIATQRSGYRT